MAENYRMGLNQTTLKEHHERPTENIDATGKLSSLERTIINLHGNGMHTFGVLTEKDGKEVYMQLTYPKDSVHTNLTPDIKELQGQMIKYVRNSGEDEQRGYTRWKVKVLSGEKQGTTYEWLRYYKLPPKHVEHKKILKKPLF